MIKKCNCGATPLIMVLLSDQTLYCFKACLTCSTLAYSLKSNILISVKHHICFLQEVSLDFGAKVADLAAFQGTPNNFDLVK